MEGVEHTGEPMEGVEHTGEPMEGVEYTGEPMEGVEYTGGHGEGGRGTTPDLTNEGDDWASEEEPTTPTF